MCYKFYVEDEVSGSELGLSRADRNVATSPTSFDGPNVFAATARGCTWIMKLVKDTGRHMGENMTILEPCHVASSAEIDNLRRQQADCLAGYDTTHIPWGCYLPTEAIAEDSTDSHRSILRQRGACRASRRVSFSPEVKNDEGRARRCGRDRIGYVCHLDSSHKVKALHIRVVDGTSDLINRCVVRWFEEKIKLKVESMILSPDSRGACVIFADSDTAYQALLCLHSLMNAAKTNHCELHDSCVLVKSLSGIEDQEGFDEAVLSTGRYILEELEGDDHREFNRRRRQGPFIPSPRQCHNSLDDTSTFPATKSAGGECLKRSGNRFSILNPVGSNDKIEQDHGRMDLAGGFVYASTSSLSGRRHSSKSASSLPRGWVTSTSSRAETVPESAVIYKRLSRMARRNRSRTTNQHKLRSFQKNKPLKDTPGDADQLRRIFDDARALKENANRHLHPEPSFVYRGYFNGNGRHEYRRNYRRKRRIQRRMRNAMLSPFGLDSAPKPPEVEVEHWARECVQRSRLLKRGPGISENESEDHRVAQPCMQRCCSGKMSFLPTQLLTTPVGGENSHRERAGPLRQPSAPNHDDTGEPEESASTRSGLPLMSKNGADAVADRLVKSSDSSAMARSIARLLYLSEQMGSETPDGIIATGTSDLKQKLSVLPLPAAQMQSIGQEGFQAGAEIAKDAITDSITWANFGGGKRTARAAASPKRLSTTKRSNTEQLRLRVAPSNNSQRTMQLFFRDQHGNMKVVDVDPAGTIADVKQSIFHSTCIPPESQRLVFNCKDLHDSMTIGFYNISGGSEISLNARFLGGDPNSLGPKGGDMIEEFREFICILKEEFEIAKNREGDMLGGTLDTWFFILKSPKGLEYGQNYERGEKWLSSKMAFHNLFLGDNATFEQKESFIRLLWELKRGRSRIGMHVLRDDVFKAFALLDVNFFDRKSLGGKDVKVEGVQSGAWMINFSTHAASAASKKYRRDYDFKELIHRDLGRRKKWSRKGWIDRAVERFHFPDSLSDDENAPPVLEDDDYGGNSDNIVHTIVEEGISGQSGMARGSALTIVPNAPLEGALSAPALVTPTNQSATYPPRLSSDEEAKLEELLERPGAYEVAMKTYCKEKYQRSTAFSNEEWKLLSHLLRRADSVKMNGNSVTLEMRHKTRGQRSRRKYYRAPPRRKRSRKGTSVREISKIFKDMTVDADVDIKDCIRRVSKKFLKDEEAVLIKKLTKEESIVASIAFRKACNIYSGRQYERLREYVHIDVFGKSHRIYSSLQSQRKYFRKKSPKESYYDEMIYMDVGTKKNRKVKLCHVWHSKFPLELVSTEMTRIFSTGMFRSSEEFSNSSDHFVYFGMNSDKAEKCISVMGRILNEPRANQAENNILFAQTSGNASENYFNMHRLLCRVTPRHKRAMGGEITKHTMHEFKQASFDDEVVYLYLDLDSETSLERKKIAVAFLMKSQDGQEVEVSKRASDDLIAFESLLNEVVVNTETEASHQKYLKRSSYQMMRVGSADEVAFIRDESTDTLIGVAKLDDNGNIDTWVRTSEYHNGFKVKSVKARRQIGLECSDGKMACTLAGHQGYSATYPCPICLWNPAGGLTRGEMESLLDTESPLRWGEYDNHKMFEAGKDMPDATPGQKAEKVAVNKNINKEPLFRIHPCKKHCGIMHGEMGCFSHVEKRMIKNLKKIEDDTNLAGPKATWARHKLTQQLVTLKDAEQNLRKDVRNRVAAIKGWEEKLEGYEKQAEQEKLETGEVTKNTQYLIERRREDVDPSGKNRKDLALREDALKNLQIKIEAHVDSIQTIDEYADRRSTEKDSEVKNAVAGKGGTNHYILVNILDEAYAAQGVPLGQHHGGRAIIHRHFVKLLCRWDVIMEWVIATIESRFPKVFNVEKVKEELFYASDIMFELAQITRIQSSQNKLDEDTIKSLDTHWNNYVKKLYQRYPGSNPFFKAHNGVAHLSKAAKYLGFLGLANEQGFEAWHAYFNRMLPTLQSIRNHADRSQVLRQFCVGGASDEIKNWQQRVDDQRIKRKRKSKVDKTDIKSLREVSICNFLEAFRFQADSYDGVDLDQFDAAIIDVDKLTDLQVEVELRVRNEDASGSSEECRKRLKDIIATEGGEEDNDAVEAPPAVEQDDQESDDAPPSSEQPDCRGPDDPTTAVEIQDIVEPAPSMLLSRCLETPSYLKNKATDDVRVFKCHLCDRHVPEDALAYHIIVHHDACEVLPTVGEDNGENEQSEVSAVSASDIEDMGIDELKTLCDENDIPTGGTISAAKMRSELIKALFPVDGDDGDEDDDVGDDDEEDSEETPMGEAARRRRDVLRICALKVSQLKKELDEAGVKFNKRLKKADLQQLLLQHHRCTLEDANNTNDNSNAIGSSAVNSINNGPSSPARPSSGRSMATSKSPHTDVVKSPRPALPPSPGSSMATSTSPYKDAIMSPAASRSARQGIENADTSVSRAGRPRKKTAKARQHEEEYRNNLSSPGIAKKRGRKNT